jgi:hypothetical protein
MIYFQRTQRGRVVYHRKPHLITSSDAARFVDTAYTRESNNLWLYNDDQRWKLAASAHDAICRTLDTWQPGELIQQQIYGKNTATIIQLIEIYEALRSVLDFIAQYASAIPYVGQTANIGQVIIDGLLTILGDMPPYYRNEYGQIVLI